MLNEKEKLVLDNYKVALLSGKMTPDELHNLVISSEAIATLTDVRTKKAAVGTLACDAGTPRCSGKGERGANER